MNTREAFDAEHINCDAPWFCLCCDEPVCPRCDPSPAEEELCAACWWIADPGDGAA